MCTVSVTKLAKHPESKRVDFAAVSQDQAVRVACCHRTHAHAAQRLNHPWRHLVVLVAVPEPPMRAERVNGTAGAQHQAVRASRRQRTHLDATQPLDDLRRALVLLILPWPSPPPSPQPNE
eukprot:6346008-Prymnesium_polylepis.1